MPGRKRQPVGVKKPARGAAMAPPNVQGRRRGPMGRAAGSRAPKANPRDLYEADEADPEETRNAQRYDVSASAQGFPACACSVRIVASMRRMVHCSP